MLTQLYAGSCRRRPCQDRCQPQHLHMLRIVRSTLCASPYITIQTYTLQKEPYESLS